MKHTGKIAALIAVAGLICVTLILFGARMGLWEPIVGFGLYRSYFNAIGVGIFSAGLIALAIHLGQIGRAHV